MSNSPTSTAATARLADERGNLTMLALDQRESLRGMFLDAGHGHASDEVLRRFKSVGVHTLSPYASAVLLDREYGLDSDGRAELRSGGRLILAADVLMQEAGGPVTGTVLDPEVTPAFVTASGAEALKLLIIWRAGEGAAERARLVEAFLALCRATGTVSLVEAIVRQADASPFATDAERHAAIFDAAVELAQHSPDVYKAEVPGYVPGDVSKVAEESRRLSDAIDVPWVVLSNGVRAEDFEAAVGQACAGGASGFLAGRAIWADTVATEDYEIAMADRSVARLIALSATVDNARRSSGH